MTRTSKGIHQALDKLDDAATLAGAHLLRINQGGIDEFSATLTQLVTFLGSLNLGSVTFDDITVSSMTISALNAAGSAMTFTTTGQTSGAVAAVTSGVNFGFATKGQIEFIIETVKNNKAAIDILRS